VAVLVAEVQERAGPVAQATARAQGQAQQVEPGPEAARAPQALAAVEVQVLDRVVAL
jgi:hypothetical protein